MAPVLVWIHGGGFTSGSKTSAGNPAGIISRSKIENDDGIIFVSINYRLGLFGWLGAGGITPNLGLHDQRVALEWVQKYIGLFGTQLLSTILTPSRMNPSNVGPVLQGAYRRTSFEDRLWPHCGLLLPFPL